MKTRLENIAKQYKRQINEMGLKPDATNAKKGSEYVKKLTKDLKKDVKNDTTSKKTLQDIIEELRCK